MSTTLHLVPVIVADDGALCAQSDPAAWYPAKGDTGAEEAAKAICRRCPLFFQCYPGAVARGEIWGIWGGANFEPPSAPADLADEGDCGRGHVLNETNAYVAPSGRIECRICKRDNRDELRRREREAPGAECGNRHVRTEENTYEDARGHLRCRDCTADLAAKRAEEAA